MDPGIDNNRSHFRGSIVSGIKVEKSNRVLFSLFKMIILSV